MSNSWSRPFLAWRRASLRCLAVATSITLIAGCTAETAPVGTPSIEPASTNASASSTPDAIANATEQPAPVAAWELDGDGFATTGGSLTFTGVHEFSGDAVVLDGRTAYGATSGTGPLDTTASFTAAAWVTMAREAEFGSVLSQVGNVAAAFYLGTGEGVWSFAMKDLDTNDPGHTIRALAGPPLVDPDTWVHVVGVFDDSAGEIRLFIDGELAAATDFDGPWQAHGPLAVGAGQAHSAPSDHWPGAVGHAAVYQAALSDAEIAWLHESTRPSTKPPVMAEPDPETYGYGVLDGTWDLQLSEEQVESLNSSFSPEEASAVGLPDADTKVRLGFSDNTWWLGFVFDDELWLVGGVPEGDGGTLSIDRDELSLTNGVDGWITFRWSINDDELTLTELGCATQSGEDVECEPGPDFLTPVQTYTFSGNDATY